MSTTLLAEKMIRNVVNNSPDVRWCDLTESERLQAIMASAVRDYAPEGKSEIDSINEGLASLTYEALGQMSKASADYLRRCLVDGSDESLGRLVRVLMADYATEAAQRLLEDVSDALAIEQAEGERINYEASETA
jgi:hypothetical protein